MNYNNVLCEICKDETVPIYRRKFATLFRCVFAIIRNLTNNKQMAIFSNVCEDIITIYCHRLFQVVNDTISKDKSIQDYDELKKIVHSMHREIRSNDGNPIETRDQIEKQLMHF